ncbi:hypothetical protein BT93_C1124 [Corymbia citriodora subsp. variegata]|nr:hypothetical protein BT93_C1124 [Corymbia citriodora subsp. variegata]
MAPIIKFLWAVLLLLLFGKGTSTCSTDKVTLTQGATGNLYLRKPEYNVTIHNGCTDCAVVDLSLLCPGFKTVEPIDPSVLQPSGDYCIVSRGRQIDAGVTFNFIYAWDSQYPFKIAHLGFKCAASPRLKGKGVARP